MSQIQPTSNLDANAVSSQGGIGLSYSRLINYYKEFKVDLAGLMKDLIDEESDLELDGHIIPSDEKYGAAGTMLVNEWLSEQEFVFSRLLESYKFNMDLEKKLQNFSFT